jgi:subtilisin family serine protease
MNRFFLLLCSLLISCSSNHYLITNNSNFKKSKIINEVLKNWHHKDINLDSIPGISLDRAYQELIKNKKGKEIIVAVLDMQIDLNHEDLRKSIWLNDAEIPNNNLDDDKNGYIDDVNGWNFIGNKKGESLFNSNFIFTRVVKKFKNKFKSLAINDILNKDKKQFIDYQNALIEYNENLSIRKNNFKNFINWGKRYEVTKKILKEYFPNNNYTIDKLNEIKTNDSIKKDAIINMLDHIDYGQNDKWLKKNLKLQKLHLNFFLNLNYDERKLVGDDVNDINDTNYGYHNIAVNQDNLTYHATYVAGILAATRNNNIGVKGISNDIKIMPIVISPNGDEFDKDIALAIKYAVDSGAKIINMSSTKKYSLHSNWVENALIYASKNDILFITSAGNNSVNIDNSITFPNDSNKKITNFINVGATSYECNGKLLTFFSNIGKENVDIFAPGKKIYTTQINNTYRFVEGTSFSAPIVSGIAALIWSYYPKLKAHQVKEILLASGVSYDIDVEIIEDGKKKLVPFSSLSKSGKIVNAYNALLYAKNYKKWKAGKWPK